VKKRILEHPEDYIAYALGLVGLLLILIPGRLTEAAPLLVGAGLRIWGVFDIAGIVFLGHVGEKPGRIILFIALGAAIIHNRKDGVELMGFVWAIVALSEAAEEINEFIAQKKVTVIGGLLTLISIVLAVMLLFEPFEHFSFHVRILGIEMLLSVVARQWMAYKKIKESAEKKETVIEVTPK
jgi:uncharacterized membrane protein HdeD (DUF308 family)